MTDIWNDERIQADAEACYDEQHGVRSNDDIAAIARYLRRMRDEYEQRIADLEAPQNDYDTKWPLHMTLVSIACLWNVFVFVGLLAIPQVRGLTVRDPLGLLFAGVTLALAIAIVVLIERRWRS